jgi:hypothetical protein
VAEYIATEQDTSESLRKPFQVGRGAIAVLLHALHGRKLADYGPVPFPQGGGVEQSGDNVIRFALELSRGFAVELHNKMRASVL